MTQIKTSKEWVLVGSIGRPYGIKGWVKVNSYTEPQGNILGYRPWYLKDPTKEQSLTAIKIKDHSHSSHKTYLTVQFENHQTPESVRSLTRYQIYIKRETLPPLAKGEYYWTDLEGLKVYTAYKNTYLGTVQRIFATGSNDILTVKGEKNHFIPFLLDQVIQSIDLEQQSMIVDWDPNF